MFINRNKIARSMPIASEEDLIAVNSALSAPCVLREMFKIINKGYAVPNYFLGIFPRTVLDYANIKGHVESNYPYLRDISPILLFQGETDGVILVVSEAGIQERLAVIREQKAEKKRRDFGPKPRA